MRAFRSEGFLQHIEQRRVICKEYNTIGSLLGLVFSRGGRCLIQGFWRILMHQRNEDHIKERADRQICTLNLKYICLRGVLRV